MLLWHGHQWGQGAGCAGRRLQRNTARLSRQQSGGPLCAGPGRTQVVDGPPLWRGGLCGSLIRSCHHSPPPHPPQTDCCPVLGHSPIALVLAVPQSPPHPSPHTYSFTLTHQPCLAVAVSPGYATLLVSGQELWGLFRATWSGWGARGRMEQRPRSQADTIL